VRPEATAATTIPPTATPDASLCTVVEVGEAVSRWTRAATANPAPAIISAKPEVRAEVGRLTARLMHATATSPIARSTAAAHGNPGAASRLTVLSVQS